MTTDRELLEAAAKADGVELLWRGADGDDSHACEGFVPYQKRGASLLRWNPLTDDGNAFRLMVKLNLFDAARLSYRLVSNKTDFDAAARLAIVRAAAAQATTTGEQ